MRLWSERRSDEATALQPQQHFNLYYISMVLLTRAKIIGKSHCCIEYPCFSSFLGCFCKWLCAVRAVDFGLWAYIGKKFARKFWQQFLDWDKIRKESPYARNEQTKNNIQKCCKILLLLYRNVECVIRTSKLYFYEYGTFRLEEMLIYPCTRYEGELFITQVFLLITA